MWACSSSCALHSMFSCMGSASLSLCLSCAQQEQQEREEQEKKEGERRKLELERLEQDKKEREEEVKKKELEDMKRKIAEEKLEALRKTGLGARAFADITAHVSITRHPQASHFLLSSVLFFPSLYAASPPSLMSYCLLLYCFLPLPVLIPPPPHLYSPPPPSFPPPPPRTCKGWIPMTSW